MEPGLPDCKDVATSRPMLEHQDAEQEVVGTKNTGLGGRDQWSSRMDYIMSLVGYCVGFGNLWRFPYICNRNGGGAFLIPYLIFLVATAFPMFYLESCLSQYSGKATIQVWNFCPLFKGIGVGAVLLVLVCLPYYNILLAYPIYYMIQACSEILPWTTCGNSWNTDECVKDISGKQLNKTLASVYNGSLNDSFADVVNQRQRILELWKNKTLAHSAVEEFYQYNTLGISGGLSEVGSVQWHLVGCLFASYVIIFLCLFRSIKATGKIVYLTALLPYILLLIIFIRIALLPGAMKGITLYLTPDFSQLWKAQVWLEACLQVFYSLGPGIGVIATASSFNRFHGSCFRDSIIICIISEGTSVFSGFVTFAIMGVMAEKIGIGVSEVVSSGPGLGYVAYPEALSKLPIPQLWSFIFFVMLLFVGLDTQFVYAEILSTAIMDSYPKLLRKKRTLVIGVLCIAAFIAGIPFCTQGGPYIFQLFDWYVLALCVAVNCFIECIAAVWIYGIRRLNDNISAMLGYPVPIVVKIFWGIITPGIFLIVLILTLIQYEAPTYGKYVYPEYASVIGWMSALVPVVPIPVYMVVHYRKQQGQTFKERLLSCLAPNKDWKAQIETSNHDVDAEQSICKFQDNLQFIFK